MFGDHAYIADRHIACIGCLDQNAAADALQVIVVLSWLQRYFQQSHILLRCDHLARFGVHPRGDDHFDELLNDSFGCGFVQLAVEGDDAAEGRRRVGLESSSIRIEWISPDCNPARIGVFDDHASRGVKTLDALPGRVGVADVVVRQFLALQLNVVCQRSRSGLEIAVKSRRLMRVLPVA